MFACCFVVGTAIPEDAIAVVQNCKDVHDDETTGAVWAALGESDAAMIVSFEKVHIEVVIRSVMRVRDEFV
jgi:hypothetical protein